MVPGTSAIVAIIEHKWVAELEREMAEAVAEHLETGHEAAYTALGTAEDQAAGLATVGDEAIWHNLRARRRRGQRRREGN
jgi:hypothetical protein